MKLPHAKMLSGNYINPHFIMGCTVQSKNKSGFCHTKENKSKFHQSSLFNC